MKPIIFTDLDGTLLKSTDYSFDEASPALARIESEEIPLVLSSSKTRAEIEALRERIGNWHPFISENGGGIFIPKGYFPFMVAGEDAGDYLRVTLGRPYDEVRAVLNEIKPWIRGRIRGFGDMTDEELAALTGLSPVEASLARKRDFDEPFLFEGTVTAEKELVRKIEIKRLNWTKGRFLHILGRHSKGEAARVLKGYYARLYGETVTIALGDGLNDFELLREADYPVLVEREGGGYENIEIQGCIRAEGAGPSGWNRAVLGILDSIDASYRGYTC